MKLINIAAIMWLCFLMLLASSSAYLGTFQQNQCIPIVTVLNSSTVNISTLVSPAPNSTILLSNVVMTKSGNAFNYTFCNTSILGTYTYGFCDDGGECYSNDFLVNGSGKDVTDQQIWLIMLGMFALLIAGIFFFVLSIIFKHPGTKLFLMALAAGSIILLIGIIAGNGQVYLAEFPGIASVYNSYYITIISLAGACMVGIIVWLIYYGLTLFNKSRGRAEDDD